MIFLFFDILTDGVYLKDGQMVGSQAARGNARAQPINIGINSIIISQISI